MKQKLLRIKRDCIKLYMLSLCLICLSFQIGLAQNRVITGKVEQDDGNVAVGASVKVKGQSIGTTTKLDGTFSLSVPDNTTLIFSYIGFITQEVSINGKATVNIRLITNSKTLQQVNVVAIGYGSQTRKDITGAVGSISGAEIEKTPVTTLGQAIQGRAAGVQVTNDDGTPGGSLSVQIRGVGTFGSNEPLYVIDGYPVTTGLSSINQNDIASIDILKDASATAIYGNRASNGVVIITTKRGSKNGGVQVTLDGLGSVQTEPRQYKVLDAQQYATLANARTKLDNFAVPSEWINPGSLQNIDWQKEVYRTGYKQNYNLGIRGGDEKTQVAFSAGYLNQSGITLGSFFKRYNVGLNADYQALKWLKSSTSLKYSRSDNKVAFGTGGQDAGLGIGTLSKLIPSMNGNPLTNQAKDNNGNYGFYSPTNQFIDFLPNPVYFIDNQDQKNLTNYFLGTTSLEATIIKGLRIKTNLGINTTDYSGYYFTPADDRMAAVGGSATLAFYSQSANNTYDYLWENTLAYTRDFGRHNIDFVGGISYQKDQFREVGGSGNGSPSNELRTLQSLTNITSLYGNEATYGLVSQFARLNYKYADKYIITGTVRRDGSSRFAQGHQYGVFPSVSAAWRVKNEAFLKNVQSIYDLKIRGGYGEVGNQNTIPLYQYLAQYTNGGPASSANNVGYPFGKVYQPGLVLAALPNPNLKWEISKQTDIGMDAGFLGGALNVTIDYYDKTSSRFLLNIPVPSQTGFTTAARNVGSISNKGLEFNVEYRESKNALKYGLSFNLTTVNNKILSLADGLNSVANFGQFGLPTIGGSIWNVFSRSAIGGPVGEFYGFKSAGIFQTQAQINSLNAAASAKNGGGTVFYQSSTTQPGDRQYIDINGDGRITDDDRVALGSPIPKFFSGFNFDASYKAFDFNMFWYASVGNKIFNYQERTLETFGATQGGIGIENISEQYYQNAWTPTNLSNRYARITKNDTNGNSQPSDIYVEDGSYLRLRSVQFGYTLPVILTKKINVSKIRLYLSAQNLLTITKYSGLDPEIGQPYDGATGQRSVTAAGLDVGTYPSSRYFTVGFNLTF